MKNPAPSERELQVLTLIAEGRPNRVIGAELWLTEDTVKSHCQRLYRKLGARDRAHAVAIAYQRGLLEAGVNLDERLTEALKRAQAAEDRAMEHLTAALIENAALRRDLRLQQEAAA